MGKVIREKGDRYRPVVKVLKTKKDVPTVIEVSGLRYVLKHETQHPGGRKK